MGHPQVCLRFTQSLGNGDRCESRGKNKTPAVASSSFTRDPPDQKKKKRSGGVVAKCYLYPSCEREREEKRGYGSVYIFLIIRIPSSRTEDGTA